MVTGLIETEDDLHRLLSKIDQACKRVGKGVLLEEFTIIRRLPGSRPPFVQFIHGVMPEGYNPFTDGRTSGSSERQAVKARRRKRNKKRATI